MSRPWGGESIHLQLPASRILIDGLSTEQQGTILRDYASFVVAAPEKPDRFDVICHAARLAQPIGLPLERFAVNEQYTPLKRRTGMGIEIVGSDFVGHFVRGGPVPVLAELSVEREEQFAWRSVLENFLRIIVAHNVLDKRGVLLHSAGVLYQDRAFVFLGRSNAGKTTLARKASAAGAKVLSDDINLVMPENGEYWAHKVPFTGEFGRSEQNLSGSGAYRLGGLALLEKAPKLTTTPMRPAESLAGLLIRCPFVNDDAEEVPVLMGILTEILLHCPVIRMGVGRDDSFDAVMEDLLRCCEND